MIDSEFVTNGHAAFSADLAMLLVAENDAMTGEGFIGIYDVESLETSLR